MHDTGRPWQRGAINGPTADRAPAGFRRPVSLNSLSERTTQALDELSVDSHLAPTVRAGLQVGQVRPGTWPEVFTEGKLLQELATCAATAHGSTPLHRPERVALPGAAIVVP